MDSVTHQVAANAEETAAISEEFSVQAKTMNGIVGQLHKLVGSSRLTINSNKSRGGCLASPWPAR